MRQIFFKTLTQCVIITQITSAPLYADNKTLNKVHALAPSSLFSSSTPNEGSEEFRQSHISKIEFLSIAFDLYASLIIEKSPIADFTKLIDEYSASYKRALEHLLKIDFNNIKRDVKSGILYIPYGDDLEVRVYERAKYHDGLPLNKGERLLERGEGDLYAIDVVSAPSDDSSKTQIVSKRRDWQDRLAQLSNAEAIRRYRQLSESERDRINPEKIYWSLFNDFILPKLKAARHLLLSQGKPAVLTLGITGSAASGKTTITEGLLRPLSQDFVKVRTIFFDDWLLQASDRPIEPATGKTTEDVFKKFEADKFVKSIKAFIKGQHLLKPIYHQTAKGNLKLTLDEKGQLVILFGPNRNILVIDTPQGVVLSVRDEKGKELEAAKTVSVFDIPLAIEEAETKKALGGFVLKVFDTRIAIGTLNEKRERRVQTIDRNGNNVPDMIDISTGELLADSGATLTKGGHIAASGEIIDKAWKVKEYIPHEDGLFIIEGILSLYDKEEQEKVESLSELYTASLFVDADFEVRLERGLAREKARVEKLKGRPMNEEETQKYITVFTQRKEHLEDPFIYKTRDKASLKATTATRAEGIFSLYRKGELLLPRFQLFFRHIGLNARELYDELERIEEDFILDKLRRSTLNRELKYERKVEGPNYNVYFLKDGIIVKVPKPHAKISNIASLKLRGGSVMVPGSMVDLSKLKITINGAQPGKALVQNEITPLDTMLKNLASQSRFDEARYILDCFIKLEEKMWGLGIVDMTPGFHRYGSMIANQGRPEVLFFAIDNISEDITDLNPSEFKKLAADLHPKLQDYFRERVERLLKFMTRENFGVNIDSAKMLPRLYHPQISSRQLNYINNLILGHKTDQLWGLYKDMSLANRPKAVSPEVLWTRLWLNTIARYTEGARTALENFYEELLSNPTLVKNSKPHILREHIIKSSQPLSSQDKAQINKFLVYLCRIPLKMFQIGKGEGEVSSTLRIKQEVYDQVDKEDKENLYNILSNPNLEKMLKIMEGSGGRIRFAYTDKIKLEGRTIYIYLRKPAKINGKEIAVLRIKGARPNIQSDGTTVKEYEYGGVGVVRRVMESYASGSIIVRPGYREPWGTMPYQEALTEYELMEQFNGSTCDTDAPIGVGRYRTLSYKNNSVGYVICGMEYTDRRLSFDSHYSERATSGKFFMNDIISGLETDITEDLPGLYEELGRAMRYFNDRGFVHRWPHIGNIGIELDKRTNKLHIILRDLNTAQDMSANSTAEKVADRFLDVSRILYDLLDREYEVKYDETYEIERASFLNLAGNFLRGYFPELAPGSDEFKGLLTSLDRDFATRINMLADSKMTPHLDYEELNTENPYFGKLVALLERVEKKTSDGNPSSSEKFDAKSVQSEMEKVKDIDRAIAPYADRTRPVLHIIDSSLVPAEQTGLITHINKLTRREDIMEKVIIGNPGETIDETIAKALQKYPNAIIDAAVTNETKQDELAAGNILSLVFKPEEGRCNFRHIEAIVAALRTMHRGDKENLLKLYELLTGKLFNQPIPAEMRELVRKLIFRLPAIEIKDMDELRKLNDALLNVLRAA